MSVFDKYFKSSEPITPPLAVSDDTKIVSYVAMDLRAGKYRITTSQYSNDLLLSVESGMYIPPYSDVFIKPADLDTVIALLRAAKERYGSNGASL